MSRAADEVVTPESQEIMDRLDKGEDISGIVEEMRKSYFTEESEPAAAGEE
jgi:hypothetical protein